MVHPRRVRWTSPGTAGLPTATTCNYEPTRITNLWTAKSDVPKPRQMFGPRSLLWRVMPYFGHKDFSAADVSSANDRLDVLVESGDR